MYELSLKWIRFSSASNCSINNDRSDKWSIKYRSKNYLLVEIIVELCVLLEFVMKVSAGLRRVR